MKVAAVIVRTVLTKKLGSINKLCVLCAFAVNFLHREGAENAKKIFKMTENEISSKIIGAGIEVHKQLGPGLLESTYEVCLAHELKLMGLEVKQQVPLPIIYKEIKLNAGYRIDMIVENKVIVEIKSVDALAPIHTAQILTYLKLKEVKLGLLINFNSVKLIDGLKRIVNNL
ncbi:GxxExxY protein [Aequorivita nionensis]